MHRRRLAFAVLLAVLLTLALVTAATAMAADSPSPAPVKGSGVPEVTGVIPNPDDPKGGENWTGDQVIVNYDPNGAALAFDKCQLFINGKQQALSEAAQRGAGHLPGHLRDHVQAGRELPRGRLRLQGHTGDHDG